MPRLSPQELSRIARLRSYVATFTRGGEYRAAAQALLDLGLADQRSGLHGDALRRAWQAAALSELGEAPIERAQALLQLGTLLLERDQDAAARDAGELAADTMATLDGPVAVQLGAAAHLLAGMAARRGGDELAARTQLDAARDRFVACQRGEGAALALCELALLDLGGLAVDSAELCFTFARRFSVAAGAPGAIAATSATAAAALAAVGRLDLAARWGATALEDSDAAGDLRGAALQAGQLAAWLEGSGEHDQAVAAARDTARRCERLGRLDPDLAATLLAARLVLARLGAVAEESLRHLEAAFELALEQSDHEALTEVLERTVGGLVDGRFPAAAWSRVERFRRSLHQAGLPSLAEAAAVALAELQ